jgi:hypothetical protein
MAEPDYIGVLDVEMTSAERAAWEKVLEARREQLAWVLAQGLEWSKSQQNDLVHPIDPDLSAWRNPHTEELLLSPKLGEHLKEDLRRVQGE